MNTTVRRSVGGTVLSPDAQQLVLQDDARLRVERGERLVHQQDLGLVRHEPRERDALPHAAGKLVRILALGARQADEVDRTAARARARASRRRPLPAGP